jgi:hypothetical protein
MAWTNRTLPLQVSIPNTSASFQSGIYSTNWRPRTTPRRRARALAPTISTIERENSQVLPSSLAQASAPKVSCARLFRFIRTRGIIVAAHTLFRSCSVFLHTPRCCVYLFSARHKQRDLNLTPPRDRIRVAFSKQNTDLRFSSSFFTFFL